MRSSFMRVFWVATSGACVMVSVACGGPGSTATAGDPEGEADGSVPAASDAASTADAKPAGDAAGSLDAAADADAGAPACNAVQQTGPTPVRSVAPAPTHQGGAIVPGRYHMLRETSPNGKFDELRRTTWVIGGKVIESRGVKPSSTSGVGEITNYSFTSSGIDLDLVFTCLGPGNAGLGDTRHTNYTATPTTLTLSYLPSGYTVEFELQP